MRFTACPELFETLQQKAKGRFLILGSASLDLLRQSGETLAGRIAYIDMAPLSILEIEENRKQREQLWLRGGFPDSYLAESERDSLALRKDFIRTYLERDVPLFNPRIPATTLERLWTMLAHRKGNLLNASELGRALEVSTQTVNRYIDLLEELLLVRRLAPYHANIGKRLVKSPKVYIRDSGIVHALLGLETLEQLAGHPVVGRSWEGFVLETLQAVLPWRSTAFFYRTAAGAEVDLLLEHNNGAIWAIEIKRALSAKPRRGFYQACADLQPTRAFVVHASDDRYPIADTIEAISVCQLAQELRNIDA